MNIKTKLILATTAVALLSAPASARFDSDEGGASAYPRFGNDATGTRRTPPRPMRGAPPFSPTAFSARIACAIRILSADVRRSLSNLAAGFGPPSFFGSRMHARRIAIQINNPG